jgi:chitin synthase
MYWFFYIFHKFHLLFDVRVAQKYEYTVAHILDKNFESLTGFLHVLPGACKQKITPLKPNIKLI